MRIKEIIIIFICSFKIINSLTVSTDICIYGGTSAGVIAAYTAKKLGKSVCLIEPGIRIGGMTAGGLGWTDFGNKASIQGYSREFYRRVGKYYNQSERWTFEPKVALKVFQSFLKEVNLSVMYNYKLQRVVKQDRQIKEIVLKNKQSNVLTVKAKVFLDCTYEGDLMARANVSYTIGRESNTKYNETYNGVQLRGEHQFPDHIDPYKIPGNSSSGLLWGISESKLSARGTGDRKVQAYNLRICLTNKTSNRVEIVRPEHYNPDRYELLLRYIHRSNITSKLKYLKFSMVTADKTDVNNEGPFSTDMIGVNYDYPEGDYDERDRIVEYHREYTLGLLYFVTHDSRVPGSLRQQMTHWGLPRDEYVDTAHLTPQLYIRESRRMLGRYVMTERDCLHKTQIHDGVVYASYNIDSHNVQRIVVNGMVKNEGDVQIRNIKPYLISYRSLTPSSSECLNLLVPVCLSASHTAYGSIRMEPVFMELGQASAFAAVKAINYNVSVQQVNATEIRHYMSGKK